MSTPEVGQVWQDRASKDPQDRIRIVAVVEDGRFRVLYSDNMTALLTEATLKSFYAPFAPF
ncbi:MAG TPA: hypothetical protein VEA41_02210 [Salinarimonas sp.]|nr:hypothetical protein [Salinarimonas sp.]